MTKKERLLQLSAELDEKITVIVKGIEFSFYPKSNFKPDKHLIKYRSVGYEYPLEDDFGLFDFLVGDILTVANDGK